MFFFLALGLSGAFLFRREQKCSTFPIFDGLACLLVGWLFIGYWIPSVCTFFGPLVAFVFIIALIWEIVILPNQLKALRADPNLSDSVKRAGPLFCLLFGLPAYFIAGITAYQSVF